MHDHLGRLVGASASSLGGYSATYGYDAFDNNTSASVSGATPPRAIGFTFGALPLNQTPSVTTGGSATGWTYDGAGEATNFAAAPGSSSVTGLNWDGLGRMSRVNAPGLTEQEGYAPSGLRVRRDESVASLSRRYVYTSGGLLLAEYVPKTGGGWQWKRDVVYLGSQAITEVDGAGTHELHSDHLGTPRVITETVNGTAAITGRQNYGPYGELFPAMNSGYQPLTGYTGHLQTDPTGLIYMRGRFYSPAWHRFVNSDQGADPSTWNQMAYVEGSPMRATDPSGMMAGVIDLGTYYTSVIAAAESLDDWGEDGSLWDWMLSEMLGGGGGGGTSGVSGGGGGAGAAPQTPKPNPCLNAKWASNFTTGVGAEWEAGFGKTDTHGVVAIAASLTNSGDGILPDGVSGQGIASTPDQATVYGAALSLGKLFTMGNAAGASDLSGITHNRSLTLAIVQFTYGYSDSGVKQYSIGGAIGLSFSKYDTEAVSKGVGVDCSH